MRPSVGERPRTTTSSPAPFDKSPVAIAGGLRVGSSAVTTRGFTEVEMRQTGRLLLRALAAHGQPVVLEEIRHEVVDLLDHYPPYEFL